MPTEVIHDLAYSVAGGIVGLAVGIVWGIYWERARYTAYYSRRACVAAWRYTRSRPVGLAASPQWNRHRHHGYVGSRDRR